MHRSLSRGSSAPRRPEGLEVVFAVRSALSRVVPAPGGARERPIGLDTSPLHGELLGVERLEERARALAAEFTLSRNPQRGPPRLLKRLSGDARVLRAAYR